MGGRGVAGCFCAYLSPQSRAAATLRSSSRVSRRDVLEGGAGAGPGTARRASHTGFSRGQVKGATHWAPERRSGPRHAPELPGPPRGWPPAPCTITHSRSLRPLLGASFSSFSRYQLTQGYSLCRQALSAGKDWRVSGTPKTTGISRAASGAEQHVQGTARPVAARLARSEEAAALEGKPRPGSEEPGALSQVCFLLTEWSCQSGFAWRSKRLLRSIQQQEQLLTVCHKQC